tara:strand:- start:913 stop:2601 length:1689 start_codon:yes stop_codon:yes gene_type:complete
MITSLSTIPLVSSSPQNDGSTKIVSTSETWESDGPLDGDVLIANGGSLTINGDITIADESSIQVEQGGTLELNGKLIGENLNAALRVDDASVIHADFGSLTGSGQLIINFDLFTTQYCNVTIGEQLTNVSGKEKVEIDVDYDGNPFNITFELYSFILPEISTIQSRDVNGVIQTIRAEDINQTGSSLAWKSDPSFIVRVDGTMNSMGGEFQGAEIFCSGECNFKNSTLVGSAPINVKNGSTLTAETSSIVGSRTDEDIVVHDSAVINYDVDTMTGTGGTTDSWIRLLSQRVIQTNLMDAGATVHFEGLGWSGDTGDNILDENGRVDIGTSESRRIIEWVSGDGVYGTEDSEVLITLNGGVTTWSEGYDILIDPAPSVPYHEVSIDLPFVSIDSVVAEDTSGTANKGLGVMITVSNTGDAPVKTNIRCYEGVDLADTTTLLVSLEVGESKKIPTTWWANASGSKALTCKALVPIGFNSLADNLASSSGATSSEISFKDAEDTEDAPIIIYAALLVFIVVGTVLVTRKGAQSTEETEEVTEEETEEKQYDENIIEASEEETTVE